MNLCRLPLGANGSASLGGVDVPIPNGSREQLHSEVVVGLRPEALELAGEGIPAVVEVVEEIGPDAYVFASALLHGEQTKLVARVEARGAPERGEQVSLRPRVEEAHLFDPESGVRLSSG
jgi:multiple sugar transport system ATP-binding protein